MKRNMKPGQCHAVPTCAAWSLAQLLKLVSKFVSELLPGQRKAENVLCKIHGVYFKNVFSGGQLSLARRPQSFSPGVLRGVTAQE